MKDIASLLPEKVISDIRAIFQSEIGCIGVVEPKKLIVQYQKFEKVIQQHRVSCGIHYVMKCNTSMKLIQTIQTLGGRVDVSSIGELEKALLLGVPPTLISANGPKNTLFLRKCIQENVYIIVDSIHELEEILRLSQELKSRPSILIRISGFTGHRPSRFGVHISLWETCIQRLSEYKDILSFQGISFHVDSADIPLRRKIFWESQTFVRGCITQGLHTKIIDIGGSYGERPDDDRSLEERITRSDGFIFPVQEITGEDFLSEVLSIPER